MYRSIFVLTLLSMCFFNLLAEPPVFEKSGPSIISSGDFTNQKWKELWNWNKNQSEFSVTDKVIGQERALKLSYGILTGRGRISTESFTLPAGSIIKISLSAKPENYQGGIWVNLEQPTEKPVSEQAEFFLAGGTSEWVNYEHRIVVKPREVKDGDPVNLKLWFYMYGKGDILLKDLKIQLITEDKEAEEKWLQMKIGSLKKTFGNDNATSTSTVTSYNNLVKYHSQKLSQSNNWGVLTTGPLARVHRDFPFYHQYSQSIKIAMVKNEF